MDWESVVTRRDDAGGIAVGVPPDLAARPLIEGMDRDPRVRLVQAPTSDLADRFQAGELACAFLPVIDALRNPLARLVPGLGLCAPRTARTEVLLSRVPLRAIGAVTAPSWGGAALARLVVAEASGALPVHASTDADAVVVGGDEALLAWTAGADVVDLGEVWFGATELPLVLGVWATGHRAPIADLRAIVSRAAQAGEAAMDRIVLDAPARHRVPADTAAACFRNDWRYRIGGDEAESIRFMVRRAARHGLLEQGTVQFS